MAVLLDLQASAGTHGQAQGDHRSRTQAGPDVYAMLTKGQQYTDQGQEYYEQRYRQRVLRQLAQRAENPETSDQFRAGWLVVLDFVKKFFTSRSVEAQWFHGASRLASAITSSAS